MISLALAPRLLTILLGMAAVAVAGEPICSVTLNVVDQFGKPYEFRLVSFRSYGDKKEYVHHFKGRTAAGIPQGLYAYVIEPKALDRIPLGSLRRDLALSSEKEFRTIVVDVWPLVSDGPGIPVRGRIRGLDGRKRAWVRVQWLFEPDYYSTEAEVQPDGRFEVIRSRTVGKFLLLVFQEDGLRQTKVFEIQKPLEIVWLEIDARTQ